MSEATGPPRDEAWGADELVRRLQGAILFEWCTPEQIRWVVDRSEEQVVAGGTRLFAPGDREPGFFVLLDGRLEVLVEQGGREVVTAESEALGAYAGAIPFVDDAPIIGARAGRTSRVLRIPDPVMREMLAGGIPIARHLLLGVQARAQRLQALLDQQEKLASLGKLSAGLAHELNNPASAAARAAAQLGGAVDALRGAVRATAHLDPDALDRAGLELRERAAADTQSPPQALELSDREEALAAWLDARGVPEAHARAASLSVAGVDVAWIEALVARLGIEAVEPVVALLDAESAVARLLERVAVATNRMSELVAAVKSFSFRDQAPIQSVDVREGLEVTLTVLAHRVPSDVEIVRDLERDLPPLEGAGAELNQVWANLLDNALDAVGERGRIVVRARSEPGAVLVEVEDDGPGIPPDAQARVFEPFFTTKDVGEGTGLGLDTVYRVVTAHGGAVDLHSEPGRTTFTVRLPR